jgi:hypothetical protein
MTYQYAVTPIEGGLRFVPDERTRRSAQAFIDRVQKRLASWLGIAFHRGDRGREDILSEMVRKDFILEHQGERVFTELIGWFFGEDHTRAEWDAMCLRLRERR